MNQTEIGWCNYWSFCHKRMESKRLIENVLSSKFDKMTNLCHKIVSIIDDFWLFWHSIILTRSYYLMRNQAEPFALFIPEHTIIPHHSMENSEPKSIVRSGLYLLRNWIFFVHSLYDHLPSFQMKSIVKK